MPMFLLVVASLLLLALPGIQPLMYRDAIPVALSFADDSELLSNRSLHPLGSLLRCDYLPAEYFHCQSVEDIHENDSRSCQKRNGRRFGGEKSFEVDYTSVLCHIYAGIPCLGNRTFVKDHVPCLKYSSHDFLATLFYSIFLGLFAVDRYSLGHIGIAVGKMITLGGLGLWWIVDIILLIFGKLLPADDSNWVPQH